MSEKATMPKVNNVSKIKGRMGRWGYLKHWDGGERRRKKEEIPRQLKRKPYPPPPNIKLNHFHCKSRRRIFKSSALFVSCTPEKKNFKQIKEKT